MDVLKVARRRKRGVGHDRDSQAGGCVKRFPTDWIIISNRENAAKCLRCGAISPFGLPCSVSMWVAAMKEFVKIHKRCRAAKQERGADERL